MIRGPAWFLIDVAALVLASMLCWFGLLLLPLDQRKQWDARMFKWQWADHYWTIAEYICWVGLSGWIYRHYLGKGNGGNDHPVLSRWGRIITWTLP